MFRVRLRLEPVATSAGRLLASPPNRGRNERREASELRATAASLLAPGAPCSSCRCAPSGASSSGELPGCASKSANPSRLQPSGSTEGEGAAPGAKSSSSSSSTFFAAEGRVSSSCFLRSHRSESSCATRCCFAALRFTKPLQAASRCAIASVFHRLRVIDSEIETLRKERQSLIARLELVCEVRAKNEAESS